MQYYFRIFHYVDPIDFELWIFFEIYPEKLTLFPIPIVSYRYKKGTPEFDELKRRKEEYEALGSEC